MRIFRSVRFNIFLGLVITVASAVGTFLPQLSETPEKVNGWQAAHPGWFKLFDFLGLFNIYQTWWFMGLLGLMAFDIVLCKLWSKPPDQGLVALPPESTDELSHERHLAQKEAALALKPYRAKLVSPKPPEEAGAAAHALLAKKGFSLHDLYESAAGRSFVGTRHGFQRWGSYLAHIAFVVILVGSLIKGLFGFVEMVPVLEGRSRAMQNKPDWELFVDKFEVAYYDGTRDPKRFSSKLRIEVKGQPAAEKIITVNDPLDIGGVRFYQASWGAGGMFRSVTIKIGKHVVQLPQRTPKKIEGTPFTLEADVMMPNFAPNGGEADTASLDLRNPAVRLTFSVGPHKVSPMWLFLNDPELCLVETPDGLQRAPKPPFQLVDVDPVLFSGIQVAYDPGFKVVALGSILWLIGTVSLFWLHRRRLWLVIEKGEGGGSEVSVGGWSSRGPKEFKREFEAVAAALGEALDAREGLSVSADNPLVEVKQ